MSHPANSPDRADIVLRDAADADLDPIAAIYARHVLHGLASFEETPPTTGELAVRRRAVEAAGLPWIVACDAASGAILGYAYAALYRPRPAYRYTVEDSIYISDTAQRRGIGRLLLGALIERCTAAGKRQMIAVIGDSANAGSIGLHAAMGFRHAATLSCVGYKFGRWVDSVLMQRPLGEGGDRPPAT